MMWTILLLALLRSILASSDLQGVDTGTFISSNTVPLSVSSDSSPTVLTTASPAVQMITNSADQIASSDILSTLESTATIFVSASETSSPSTSSEPSLETQVFQRSDLSFANHTNTTNSSSIQVLVRPTSSDSINHVAMQLQVGGANSFRVDQKLVEPPVEPRPALIVSNDSNPASDITQQELLPPNSTIDAHPDSGNSESAGETFIKNDSSNSSSTNPEITIGALLGVTLLIIGGIAFYRSYSHTTKISPSDNADENHLYIRYSLETASDSSSDKQKFNSNDLKGPNQIDSEYGKTQNEVIGRDIAYSDSNTSSQYQYLEPVQISNPQFLNFNCPTSDDNRTEGDAVNQDDTAEILDIARSAQDAAQISGYLTKKYTAHDSIVSFDSFA